MSTEQILEIESTNSDATWQLGRQLGKRLRGGEVIEMVSDLGGGKTTFIRGLAAGLGVQDVVHSPSFTVSNQYQGEKLRLYHFDFYRLQEPGLMRDELAELIGEPDTIVAVEWADIIEDVLPEVRLTIRMQAVAEETRSIRFIASSKLKYLIT